MYITCITRSATHSGLTYNKTLDEVNATVHEGSSRNLTLALEGGRNKK